MTSRQVGAGTPDTFSYDLRNRMTSAAIASVTLKYVYDHNGLRVSKTASDGTVEKYLIDRINATGYTQVLEQRDGAAALVRSFVVGRDIISQADGSTVRDFLYDGHGSTRALLDATGAVATGSVLAYDAFGVRTSTGTPLTPLQYAGEWLDTHSQMYHLRARPYMPSVGRLPSADSYQGRIADPLTLHKYVYTNGNPVSGIDPSGNMTITLTGGGPLSLDLLLSVGA